MQPLDELYPSHPKFRAPKLKGVTLFSSHSFDALSEATKTKMLPFPNDVSILGICSGGVFLASSLKLALKILKLSWDKSAAG